MIQSLGPLSARGTMFVHPVYCSRGAKTSRNPLSTDGYSIVTVEPQEGAFTAGPATFSANVRSCSDGRCAEFTTFTRTSTIVLAPPSRVSGLSASRSGDRVTSRWTNPSSTDWSRNTIRLLPGTRSPAAPLTGDAIYAGRVGKVTVTLAATRTWSISVWSTDTNGNTSTARTLTIPSGG